MDDMERRALVAKVERTTGFDVASAAEVDIAPLANGRCHWCGVPIRYVFVAWCDACMEARTRRS